MRPLRHLSIRKKLTLMMMLTSIAALLLACGAFVSYELLTFRKTMAGDPRPLRKSERGRGFGKGAEAGADAAHPGAARAAAPQGRLVAASKRTRSGHSILEEVACCAS